MQAIAEAVDSVRRPGSSPSFARVLAQTAVVAPARGKLQRAMMATIARNFAKAYEEGFLADSQPRGRSRRAHARDTSGFRINAAQSRKNEQDFSAVFCEWRSKPLDFTDDGRTWLAPSGEAGLRVESIPVLCAEVRGGDDSLKVMEPSRRSMAIPKCLCCGPCKRRKAQRRSQIRLSAPNVAQVTAEAFRDRHRRLLGSIHLQLNHRRLSLRAHRPE